MREVANYSKVPVQDYVVRQEGLCGTCIGPTIAAKAGIKSIDIGAPQLSMHSVRETCGTIDIKYLKDLMMSFVNNFGHLNE